MFILPYISNGNLTRIRAPIYKCPGSRNYIDRPILELIDIVTDPQPWHIKCISSFIKYFVMTLMGFLILLLIAAICGSIGQSLAGYDLGGCFVSIIVGFIGAYIGLWIAGKFGLPEIFSINIEGKPFPVVWAAIGSAVLTLIIALIRRAISGPRY
jgi:uncharacterized membrane protein YeaQ/YmgE (transglycosylase-associated protein family)